MPQVTLSVPNKKLPILKTLLSALGIENKGGEDFLRKTNYQSNSSVSSKDANRAFFKTSSSWEYFSNELEFE